MHVSFDTQGQSWFAHGMKAGHEAHKQYPNWTDGELIQKSGEKAVLYLLSDPEGAVRFSDGFVRGYKASR